MLIVFILTGIHMIMDGIYFKHFYSCVCVCGGRLICLKEPKEAIRLGVGLPGAVGCDLTDTGFGN